MERLDELINRLDLQTGKANFLVGTIPIILGQLKAIRDDQLGKDHKKQAEFNRVVELVDELNKTYNSSENNENPKIGEERLKLASELSNLLKTQECREALDNDSVTATLERFVNLVEKEETPKKNLWQVIKEKVQPKKVDKFDQAIQQVRAVKGLSPFDQNAVDRFVKKPTLEDLKHIQQHHQNMPLQLKKALANCEKLLKQEAAQQAKVEKADKLGLKSSRRESIVDKGQLTFEKPTPDHKLIDDIISNQSKSIPKDSPDYAKLEEVKALVKVLMNPSKKMNIDAFRYETAMVLKGRMSEPVYSRVLGDQGKAAVGRLIDIVERNTSSADKKAAGGPTQNNPIQRAKEGLARLIKNEPPKGESLRKGPK